MNSTSSAHDTRSSPLLRARLIWLPWRCKARVLQEHRRPVLDCWPRSRRAIPENLVRIDQVLTLNATARVEATTQEDWIKDRETAQVVRRPGQGVQDKTEQDRSDLFDRSARFILAKQEIYLPNCALPARSTNPKTRSDRSQRKIDARLLFAE